MQGILMLARHYFPWFFLNRRDPLASHLISICINIDLCCHTFAIFSMLYTLLGDIILAVCIISPWRRGDAISHVIEYGAREYASVSLSMSIYLSAPRLLWILMSRTSSAVIQKMFVFVITNLRLVGGRRSREPLHVHRINKFVCATLNPRACVCWKIGRQGRKYGACRRRRQNIRRHESKKGCVGPGPARERYVGWVCVCWSQDREKIVSLCVYLVTPFA